MKLWKNSLFPGALALIGWVVGLYIGGIVLQLEFFGMLGVGLLGWVVGMCLGVLGIWASCRTR